MPMVVMALCRTGYELERRVDLPSGPSAASGPGSYPGSSPKAELEGRSYEWL